MLLKKNTIPQTSVEKLIKTADSTGRIDNCASQGKNILSSTWSCAQPCVAYELAARLCMGAQSTMLLYEPSILLPLAPEASSDLCLPGNLF